MYILYPGTCRDCLCAVVTDGPPDGPPGDDYDRGLLNIPLLYANCTPPQQLEGGNISL